MIAKYIFLAIVFLAVCFFILKSNKIPKSSSIKNRDLSKTEQDSILTDLITVLDQFPGDFYYDDNEKVLIDRQYYYNESKDWVFDCFYLGSTKEAYYFIYTEQPAFLARTYSVEGGMCAYDSLTNKISQIERVFYTHSPIDDKDVIYVGREYFKKMIANQKLTDADDYYIEVNENINN
jgi:hypothetical protein